MNIYKSLKAFFYTLPSKRSKKIDRYSADFSYLVSPRRSDISEPRLNLIIPTINQELAFGGINTILQFWGMLSGYYENIRIIVMREHSRSTYSNYSQYKFVSLHEDIDYPKQIVSLLKTNGDSLPVGADDVFIATFWTTAYLAQRLARWQSQEFNQAVKPIVYMIQDFEAAFYPWSSNYVLARSTYEYENPVIAVFNTKLLQEYFHLHNYKFDYEYRFEPTLNNVLLENLSEYKGIEKSRKILIYGRPSIARNAFSMILESIRIWQKHFPAAGNWEVLSAGEPHPDIPINDNLVIKSLGKLSMEEYALTLANAAIGISLMVSPHPSYPPLEMAHFGMWVITNNFENKNLSLCHENIVSVPAAGGCFSPEDIASRLSTLCQRFAEAPSAGWSGESHLDNYLSDQPPFPFVKDIYEILKTDHA
jgi:hypothetical protein